MRTAAVVWVVLLAAACGGASQGLRDDIASLRRQQTAERARLDAVRGQIASANAEADRARENAQFEQCRSVVARLDAQVQVTRATCMAEIASERECAAGNSAHTAGATAIGCVVGIGLSVITAGAAAPLGLAGCAAGYVAGAASPDAC